MYAIEYTNGRKDDGYETEYAAQSHLIDELDDAEFGEWEIMSAGRRMNVYDGKEFIGEIVEA